MVVYLAVANIDKTASAVGQISWQYGVTNIAAMVKHPQCILTVQSSASQLSLVAISHCAGGVRGEIHLCPVYTLLSLQCAQSTLHSAQSTVSLCCTEPTEPLATGQVMVLLGGRRWGTKVD